MELANSHWLHRSSSLLCVEALNMARFMLDVDYEVVCDDGIHEDKKNA